MALTPVPVHVPFAAGLDTKTDPKHTPVGRLLVLENGVFDKGITIKKRNGYAALSRSVTGAGTDYSGAKALAARGTEPVLLTETSAYSYQASTSSWSEIGPVASVAASDESVAHTGTNQTTPDAATNNGATVLAWEDSRGGVWWTLVEAEGGRVLRAPAQLDANGTRPRCVAVGEVLHVLYATVASVGSIFVAVVNPSAPTATVTSALLTNDMSITNPSFDAAPTTRSGEPAIIAWSRTGGGYRLGYLHVSGVLGSPVTSLPSVIDDASVTVDVGPAVTYDGGSIAVVTHRTSTTTTDFITYDDGLAERDRNSIVETAAVVRLTTRFANGAVTLWREYTAANDRDHRVRVAQCFEGESPAELHDFRGVGLASRAFLDNGVAHCWLVHDVTYYGVYLCMRVTATTSLVVARTLPGVAYGLPDRAHLPSVETDASDSRIHRWCASWQQQLPAGDEVSAVFGEVGIRHVTLDFDAVGAYQTAQLGRNLYIGGACQLRYDGDTIAEAGFHYAPDDIATPTQGTTGALTTLGTYVYRVVYEEIDAQGEIHRSAPSVGTTVTLTGSNDSVTLVLPTYRTTSRRRVRIGVFRTEANDATGGLYRVTSLDPSAAGANGYVANSTTVDTISFTDEMSDAVLITKEPLYTNGGIPENDPSGSGTVLAVGKSRLFYTDPSDPLLVRFTHELADGYAAEFVAELSSRVDPYGGAVTALAVMDDRVIVFKRSAIYAMSGPGPLRDPLADTSQGFSAPGLVTSDVGCTAPASIAVTPAGIVFQSAKGIYLLGRDLGVTYVGAAVEGFNDQVVTRASLIEDRTQIVFLCSTGKTLMFDYLFGQWSSYTNHTGLDAAVIDSTYHYLRTDGRVFRETSGVYRDDNSQIPMVLETAWIKLQPYLQGLSRFWWAHLIGDRISAHTIRMRYQTDFMAGWSAPVDIDWTTESGDEYGSGNYGDGAYGGESPEIWRWRVHLDEVGSSIRFRFEDIEPTGEFGASYELTELLLEAGVKRIANRPYASTRTG